MTKGDSENMPKIYIDGKPFEAQDGKTVIETAYANGVDIPHFCWHPELSVSGSCRMCLVEIGMPKRLPDGNIQLDDNGDAVVNFFPKLQIACATPVAEGMRVRTKTEKAVEAQEAVTEFILINHPLDCPICDEAGECKLQEYAHRHSTGIGRFEEEKNHANKRQRWGDHVFYDAERCISCSRCIRYSEEIADQKILSFVNRGDKVTIKKEEGKDWDNPYSMNVIEICPVGALTSADFRFKSRVWDMSFNDSISVADASGSNTKLGVRNNEILRIEPRTNPFVNKYWLSDDARLNHFSFVNENRLTEPMIAGVEATWDEAYTTAYEKLKNYKANEIMVLGSGKATNESNYMLARFAKEVLKTQNIDFLDHTDESFADDFLGTADRLPNSLGAKEVGIRSNGQGFNSRDLAHKINIGQIKVLYVMEEDFSFHHDMLDAFGKLDLLIVHAYNKTKLVEKADIAFAASTYAETEGTFTNENRRVQHFTPALVTTENLRFMGMKMSRLDKFGSANDRWTQHEHRNCRMSWRILKDLANKYGANWKFTSAKDVFNDIATKVISFKGMDYAILDKHQGLVFGNAGNPDPVVINYESHKMKPQ
jgi:NADH-quinone oxidoreductase subunit G